MAVFANARCCSKTFSRLMMMLLIFVLCCSVFQVFVVAVLVLSRGNFLVFISNENEMTMMSSKGKIFDESCLSKMMILLIFVLCCSVCFRFLSWLCWNHRMGPLYSTYILLFPGIPNPSLLSREFKSRIPT